MKINREKVTKEFIVTEKEMQEKLDITGNITDIKLFKGLSINQEKENASTENNEWIITTVDYKIGDKHQQWEE